MAYMNQVLKLAKAPIIKSILKRYGLKGSLSVLHNSTLVLTITEGAIDFVANANRCGNHNNHLLAGFTPFTSGYMQVNPYWFHEHFDGKARDFLREVIHVMNVGNHDNSRPEIDYFDTGWYISINIGRYDKNYVYKPKMPTAAEHKDAETADLLRRIQYLANRIANDTKELNQLKTT